MGEESEKKEKVDKDDDVPLAIGRKRRSLAKQIPQEDYTIIYPAFSTIAVRADDPPYFYLARVIDDVITGVSQFEVSWLDNASDDKDLFDILEENDYIDMGTVICRLRLIPDLKANLLRLPTDQREKINKIIEKEKEDKTFEYHSSDERYSEKVYMANYYREQGMEPIEFPNTTPSKKRGRKPKKVDEEFTADITDLTDIPIDDEPPRKKRKTSLSPKRGRGRPK